MHSRKSQIASRKSEGVALIITLILLAVTLVMAIAFLAISRRERNSVSGTEDAAAAKYAMNAGEHNVEARIATQILMTTNPYVFTLLVSTNYANSLGFVPGSVNPTNVNYNYYAPAPFGPGGNNPLSAADLEQNIANLYYAPRPPVYYGSNDFRFYLDLNRNGMYDTNGWVTNIAGNGQGLGTVSLEVGDPEWIGVLAHPDQPHGPNNPFIARYCYIAVPANSLDLNYSHNQALGADLLGPNQLLMNNDRYYRNQGVGNWELNLAAFLTDLNTNIWDPQGSAGTLAYQYLEPKTFNQGVAFNDAFVLLTNRYAGYQSQHSVQNLFGANGAAAFEWDGIDAYTLGGLQTTFDANYGRQLFFTFPWMGAENTNNFFIPDDLFNTNKTKAFGIRLQNAGVNTADAEGNIGTPPTVSTYDRYTFYRMLAQMGTETKPAQGKIDLNFQNAFVNYDFQDQGIFGPAVTNIALAISMAPNYETNFFKWNPQDFFTVAANQMLKAYTAEWYEASPSNYMQTYYGYYGNNIAAPLSGFISFTNLDGLNITNVQNAGQTNQIPSFGITNIPVFVNGSFVYSPAINRVLQLAANIYDATTNTSTLINSNYPSVFRPVFFKTNEFNAFAGRSFDNVYIRGYQYVPEPLNNYPGSAGAVLAPPIELTDLPFGYSVSNVWGVPMIVGAKKGFPNFNGFELVSTVFAERELQFTRNNVASEPAGSTFPFGRAYTTNQQYVIGISNAFAMADWNSFANQYNNQVTIYGQDQLGVGLTNSDNLAVANAFSTNVWNASTLTLGLPIQPWPGQLSALPFGTNVAVMQNLGYFPSPPSTNNLYTYYLTPRPVTLQGPNGSITYTGPCFIPNSVDPQNYLDPGTPPMSHFVMMETNHLQAYMLDTAQGLGGSGPNVYIVDYVQLGSMNYNLDINAAIDDPPDGSGLWSTNPYSGSITPWGVVNQFNTSLNGTVPGEDQDGGVGGRWTTAPVPGLGTLNSPAAQQAFFAAFFSPGNQAFDGSDRVSVTNTLFSVQAPFTPMRQIVQRYVLQANDPLVHYLSSDLTDLHDDSTNKVAIKNGGPNPTTILDVTGQPSDRYLPWGNLSPTPGSVPGSSSSQLLPTTLVVGNPPQPVNVDENQYNFGYKDPLVWAPDNWDFPTNKFPTVGWLGRVHRGTPWQSVYLKSTNIWSLAMPGAGGGTISGVGTWQVWTGDMNSDDAFNESPAQDRLLFDLFTATPDDDAMRGQVSVNIGADDPTNELAGLASWSALLSGTLAFTSITNSGLDFQLGVYPDYQNPLPGENGPSYSVLTNQPLGALAYPGPGGNFDMTNASLWQIVHGINSTRTNFTAIDGIRGAFEHVGDILATPQLSDGSPFLNTGDPAQLRDAMSDEMYEWLPQQMMGLMTVSGTPQNPPRYVIYCYGQALKPAANGIVTSGTFQGLCTNYQVVAESASRVVIRVDNPPTPANPTAAPHIVVEQFNTLPPN